MSSLFEEINEVCAVLAGLGSGASLKSRVNKRQCLVRLYLLRVDFLKCKTPAWNFSAVTSCSTSTVIMQSQKISLISMMRREAGVNAFELDPDNDAEANATAVASNVKDTKATAYKMTSLLKSQHVVSGVGQPGNSLASCPMDFPMNSSTNFLLGRPANLKHCQKSNPFSNRKTKRHSPPPNRN